MQEKSGHSSMTERASLCIIGGLPRGGTRNFADLCAAHPDVKLFGEIRKSALLEVQNAISCLESYHSGGKEKASRRFLRHKHEIALSLLSMYSKSPRVKFGENEFKSGVVGFKTPTIERKFDELNSLFSGFKGKKVLFFCCRNLDEVYLSLRNLGWKSNPEEYFSHLEVWLKSFLRCHEICSDSSSNWVYLPLNLNSYIESDDKPGWLVNNLYHYIVPSVSASVAERYIDEVQNRNSTLAKTGSVRRSILTDSEKVSFESATKIQSLLSEVNSAFGVDIKMIS